MSALTCCPDCRRHIRIEEPSCPFCAASALGVAPPRGGAARYLKRTAMVAVGAAMIGTVSGCPAYGLGPEDRFDGSYDYDGGSDGGTGADASLDDAGPIAVDAGADAGGLDAGGDAEDAGVEDAGVEDAGALADAGPESDAGLETDAGADAGLETDAGFDAGNIAPPYGAPALFELV